MPTLGKTSTDTVKKGGHRGSDFAEGGKKMRVGKKETETSGSKARDVDVKNALQRGTSENAQSPQEEKETPRKS